MPIIAGNLPLAGHAFETTLCDLKTTYGGNAYECAKDVAAFANRWGGTILVGATEPKRGEVGQYRPLTVVKAKQISNEVSTAVRDRCRPAPAYGVEQIQHGQGVVLAINVEPAVTALIGVQTKSDKSKEGYGGASWTFPYRNGTDTSYYTPDNIAMLVLPKLRRNIILLQAIDGAVQLRTTTSVGGKAKNTAKQVEGRRASQHSYVDFNGNIRVVPLDAIDYVYKDAKNNRWVVFADYYDY